MQVDGVYHDGKTSKSSPVDLTFDADGTLNLSGQLFNLEYSFPSLKFSPRVGNTARNIFLPDGGQCETFANDQIDRLLIRHRKGLFSLILHALESHLGYVLAAILITILFGWGFFSYGIPVISKSVAFALPVESDTVLSNHSLDVLDRLIFSESKLEPGVQERLSGRFRSMAGKIDDPHHYRLVFRDSEPVGANAFALPSGLVVMTDQMVKLAENDEQLVAILAHEMGHVKHRHGLRTVLQNSSLVLMISWMIGDVSSLSALSAALPAQLMEAKYSRVFESEADRFARRYLMDNQIPLHHFSDILTRLEAESPSEGSSTTFLSSHPATDKRIKSFSQNQSPNEEVTNP